VFQTKESAPLLSVAGVCKAKVLVSDSALRVLDERELRTALRHELAHVRGRDNLKKLILRFSPFPGMGKLDRAWSEAAEIAADDAAVNSAGDALDLASALIKLSRLAPLHSPAPLTSGLLESSAANVKTRVERLFAWEEIHRCDTRKRQWWWYSIPLALALCMSAVVSYGAVLMQLHEVTEWLVR
jgi:beta-lactamase regulating signal transducer with metallopeptidase domain